MLPPPIILTWIAIIKTFVTFTLLSQPFLGCHLGFYILPHRVHCSFLGAATFFTAWLVCTVAELSTQGDFPLYPKRAFSDIMSVSV